MTLTKKDILQGQEKLRKNVAVFAAKVQPIYTLLNWEWAPLKAVPTIQDIVKTCDMLIDGLTPPDDMEESIKSRWYSSTGGIVASVEMTESGLDARLVVEISLRWAEQQ
jgi:hypothetical protein